MPDTSKKTYSVRPIGTIRTPYVDWAPHQPVERDTEPGRFRIDVDPQYESGLDQLDRFSHIYVISLLDRVSDEISPTVSPPWAKGLEVGLFASRTPRRPNPIGLHVVRLLRREGRVLHISPIDCLDGTPLLDLKPYIQGLDTKDDANYGWIEDLDDPEHLVQHLRGAPHDHHHHDHHHSER